MSKHTPGKWIVEEHPSGATVIREPILGHDIASVFCTDMPHGAANAELLSRAPAMLDALRELLSSLDGCGWDLDAAPKRVQNAVEQARSALPRGTP